MSHSVIRGFTKHESTLVASFIFLIQRSCHVSYNEFNICTMYIPFEILWWSFRPRAKTWTALRSSSSLLSNSPLSVSSLPVLSNGTCWVTILSGHLQAVFKDDFQFCESCAVSHKKMVWQGNGSPPAASLTFVNGLCRVWHVCKPNRDGDCMVVSVSWNRRTLKWDIPEVQVKGKWQVIVVALISNSSNSSSISGVII